MFDEEFNVTHLVGATYNPREINEESLKALQNSIRTIGMVKPVIVTTGGTIVAGHQRTKALKSMGMETSPVFVLNKISIHDEVMFNQLHNGTDLDTGEENCRIAPSMEKVEGYDYVPAESIQANFRAPGAGLRSQIAKLLARYGNWGGCVATFSGRVISGATYAMSCRVIGMSPRVYYVPDDKAKVVAEFFGREYGVFSYDKLPKTPSLQTFAQPFRLRTATHPNKSTSYEKWLLPNLGADQSVLDFGCGQGDYVRFMQKKGYNAYGIEFFFRYGRSINKSQVRRFIDKAIKAIEENGLFDHVIMDFVINSVVDMQAAHDVLMCVSAFCKPGGTIYVSGRFPPAPEKAKKSRGSAGIEVRFLDKDGFSGYLHFGGWFYQLYHTKEKVEELLPLYYNDVYKVKWAGTKWMTMAKKKVIHPQELYAASLIREFNLPWVDGERVNRHEELLAAWRPAHEAAIKGMEITPWTGPDYNNGK